MLYDFTLYKLETMALETHDGLRAMWYSSLANLYYEGTVTIAWAGGEPVPTVVLFPSEVTDIIEESLQS